MRWTSGKVNGQTDRGGHKETKEKEMQALIPRKQQRDRTTSKNKIVMGRETDDEQKKKIFFKSEHIILSSDILALGF